MMARISTRAAVWSVRKNGGHCHDWIWGNSVTSIFLCALEQAHQSHAQPAGVTSPLPVRSSPHQIFRIRPLRYQRQIFSPRKKARKRDRKDSRLRPYPDPLAALHAASASCGRTSTYSFGAPGGLIGGGWTGLYHQHTRRLRDVGSRPPPHITPGEPLAAGNRPRRLPWT